MDVIVKGSPSIEIGFERKVVDSYKAVDTALSETSKNPVENAAITKALQKNKSALATKANTTGYYPKLHVGFADDLVGRGESVPAEFSFRASGGKSIKDGAARIKRLKGNSVVWNQKMNVAPYWSMQFYNEVFSKSQVGMTYIASCNDFVPTQGDHNAHTFIIETVTEFKQGHKYLIVADLKAKYVSDLKFGIYDGADYRIINVGGGSASQCSYIYEPTSTFVSVLMRFDAEVSAEDYEKAQTLELTPRIYDLTKMFQSGNEPRTIEEFNARKPIVEDEYAYNEGEVIHMTAEGIKSVGDNAWDEEWENGTFNVTTGENIDNSQIRSKNLIKVLPDMEYYVLLPSFLGSDGMWVLFYDQQGQVIEGYNGGSGEIAGNASLVRANSGFLRTAPNASYIRFYMVSDYGSTYSHDILISLVHSGWKQDTDAKYQPYWEDRLMFDQRIKEHFPNGMQKWDMVYNKDGKGYIVKGTGVVDLGSLNWSLNNFNGYDAFISYHNALNAKYADGIFYLCEKYQSAAYRIYTEGLDKAIALNNGYYSNTDAKDHIVVRDSSYTDAATFKTAMAGVLLYYQLAEPTIIEYDEPFNLDYRVADFGTEQAIAEQPSAPISADIIYQFNAVDMIREHEIEINELQSIIATMQAQLASLMSNNE